MKMTRVLPVLVASIVALSACKGGPDIEELKSGQKEILSKLEALDKQVQQIKAQPVAAPARPTIDPNKVYALPVGESPIRGPQAAAVTITEFSDFQCPFCAQASGLIDEVLKLYPQNVKFVYKQFPLTSIHPNALPAAKAAIAAGKQGKFWEMHDIMFKNNRQLSYDNLKDYAKQIGLDVPRWEKDYNSPETQAQIDKDMALARQASVQGTPTIFVNGKRLMNRSVDGFKQMIEAELKQDGQQKG
jgi:protein-disulfide isomerase